MVEPIYLAFEILERFLATDPYLVGNHLTIADISVATTVWALQIYAPLKPDEHPKIVAWLERIKKEIPIFVEINAEPVEKLRGFMQNLMKRNKLRSKLWISSEFLSSKFARWDTGKMSMLLKFMGK